MKQERHYLNVSYAEKDRAKSLGARWDNNARCWYIPEGIDRAPFRQWLPMSEPSVIKADSSVVNDTDAHIEQTHEQAQPNYLKLSALVQQVHNLVQQHMPTQQWIVAEITEYSLRQGHLYLTLAETNEAQQQIAQVKAMIWSNQREQLLTQFKSVTGQDLGAGMRVMLSVGVNIHPRFGFALYIHDINPSFTLGEQEAKLNQIRLQLKQQGLWPLNKQLPLAKDFFRIAVLAPAQAAGLGDFRNDANAIEAAGLCEFVYMYAQFQGQQTLITMQQTFQQLLHEYQQQTYDALVIIRGGGAKQDLMFLNEFELARAVCQFPVPVFTGIGHERDHTILDEVAYRSFDTPSKVIAFIRDAIIASATQAQHHWRTIEQASQQALYLAKQHLMQHHLLLQQKAQQQHHQQQRALTNLWQTLQQKAQKNVYTTHQQLILKQQQLVSAIQFKLQSERQQLTYWQQQILPRAQQYIQQQQKQLTLWQQLITNLHPRRLLKQGYLLARTEQGQLLTRALQLAEQAQVELLFIDGYVQVQPQAHSLHLYREDSEHLPLKNAHDDLFHQKELS